MQKIVNIITWVGGNKIDFGGCRESWERGNNMIIMCKSFLKIKMLKIGGHKCLEIIRIADYSLLYVTGSISTSHEEFSPHYGFRDN